MRRWLTGFIVILALTGPPVFTETVVLIHVDDDAAPGGDGTGSRPFQNLPDAVAAAHAVAGRVVILIEPGNYPLSQTLVVDRSIELRGSTEQVATIDPWPAGEAIPGTETRLFAMNQMLGPLIRVGRGDGGVVRHVSIRGLILQSTPTSISILLNRVQDYWIADNVFRAPTNFGIQSVASSGEVTGNHFSGLNTGTIFNGGFSESPSSVVFQGNRAVGNALGGLLLVGASINIPELGDALTAVVRDNDLSENVGSSMAFGFRVFILRRDLGAPGDSQSSANVHAVVQDNRLVGNRFGVLIDAGFPYRRVGTVCDTRVYSGAVDLTFAGNTLAGSAQSPALITFTRSVAAIDPTLLSQWQYLHGATFTISDHEGLLAGAWIDHPAVDPFTGPCPADATNEPLGNGLIYNGQVLTKNF